jgi:hypothetical protein
MPWHPQLAEGRQAPGVESAGTGWLAPCRLVPRYRKRLRHAVAPAVSGGAPGPRFIPRHRKRLRHLALSRVTGNACAMPLGPALPETLAPCRGTQVLGYTRFFVAELALWRSGPSSICTRRSWSGCTHRARLARTQVESLQRVYSFPRLLNPLFYGESLLTSERASWTKTAQPAPCSGARLPL